MKPSLKPHAAFSHSPRGGKVCATPHVAVRRCGVSSTMPAPWQHRGCLGVLARCSHHAPIPLPRHRGSGQPWARAGDASAPGSSSLVGDHAPAACDGGMRWRLRSWLRRPAPRLLLAAQHRPTHARNIWQRMARPSIPPLGAQAILMNSSRAFPRHCPAFGILPPAARQQCPHGSLAPQAIARSKEPHRPKATTWNTL